MAEDDKNRPKLEPDEMAERDDDIVEMVNIDRKFSVRRTIDDIANMASPKS